MKPILTMFLLAFSGMLAKANNVQISNVSTTVRDSVTLLNFTIQWDNSWRGGPGGNYDAVWVFFKYQNDLSFYSHLDLTGTNITASNDLTVEVPSDHKGCFIYRSQVGFGNISTSQITVGVSAKAGTYNVKVFGIEMVYIPQGSFYLGHSGGNSNNFGEAGTSGTTPFHITSATPPYIGSAGGFLYDSRVTGTATFSYNWPTGYNAFYIMKYELSQASYRDFLNAPAGYGADILPERSDLTNSTYSITGSKLFPTGYRNNLFVQANSQTDPIGTNANGNTAYNENSDGEWVAANFLYWSDAAAFLDWAALRPMTEFEFEKAVNGPDAANYPQFATGTYIQVPDISGGGILNPNTPSETISKTDPSTNYINTNEFWGSSTSGGNIGQPLRSGFAADATSTRRTSGGSYYGVMELSGNLWEPVVTSANVAGRSFDGTLGDGSISGLRGRANQPTWPGTNNDPTTPNAGGEILKLNIAGISKKGGGFDKSLYSAVYDVNYDPAITSGTAPEVYPTTRDAAKSFGCRGVRQQ